MSIADSLPFVQECFTRYGMSGYVIFGNIGLIINIAFFSQSGFRQNSCSLYILTMSIYGLLGLNISTIPIISALYRPDPLTYSLFFCEIQFYLRHAFNELMRTFFVLACADRYAASNNRATIRAFSRYEVAMKVIPSVSLFWLIVAIFPTMIRTLNNGVCDARSGAFDIIYTVYILMTLGVFPLISMSIFAILISKNLKQMRHRIQPTATQNGESGGNILRKRDRDMMKMLLIELIVYIITTIPNTIMHTYKSVVKNLERSKERQEIEAFVVYIARVFLLYMMNTFSFWIYILVSRSYRLELKIMFTKFYRFLIRG